ncbi:barstar family protein [Streptomyces sp. V3I7]|uniref:barstar family protein n=1 Tax=Streptomyces sp. V3I7 TaxID=3042278 RepID=UPI0027837633|nr:barstar family protein [Streptomyces sp. V3I7]MDQ0989781.1 RNAse (barnase) inhibitor barstar [Streptomyces sp. V3I7]
MTHATLAEAVRSAGWKVIPLDLAGVTDKESFMDRATTALDLPKDFGRNWDAFVDACGDIGWGPATAGRLMVVIGWRDFAKAQPQEWENAQQALESMAGRQQEYDSTLAVVLAIA